VVTLRKELRRLDGELGDDEPILGLVCASPPYVWLGLLVLTNQRVLYVRKRLLPGRFDIRRIPLTEIETVDTRPGTAGVTRLTLGFVSGYDERFGLLPRNTDAPAFLQELKALVRESAKA
jgi:hypothetical protein